MGLVQPEYNRDVVVHSFSTCTFTIRLSLLYLPFAALALNMTVCRMTSSYLIFCCGTNKELSYLVHLSHVSALFYFLQVVVTLFLALVVGAIFFGVEENQTGSQNRFFFLCLPNPENAHHTFHIFMKVSHIYYFYHCFITFITVLNVKYNLHTISIFLNSSKN